MVPYRSVTAIGRVVIARHRSTESNLRLLWLSSPLIGDVVSCLAVIYGVTVFTGRGHAPTSLSASYLSADAAPLAYYGRSLILTPTTYWAVIRVMGSSNYYVGDDTNFIAVSACPLTMCRWAAICRRAVI